jgi:16S rRNA (uracil1498-N3)-methyltransferase
MDAKVRLYVDQPLGAGQAVALGPDPSAYLFSVMRLGVGDGVRLFNGADGEWLARVEDSGKRRGALRCEVLTAPQTTPPDLWLMFAPVRKERTAFIVEKAVELGVSRILPVRTAHTQAERWRQDKARAHATEAAEQCGATFVPQVGQVEPLAQVLANWPAGRALFWADESLDADALVPDMPRGTPSAVLIGPEGGFSESERAALRGCDFVRALNLGPRILRAETAAVAALVLWQARFGDWGGW